MWIKAKPIPKRASEHRVFDATFLLEPFSEGIKLYRQSEKAPYLLNVISVSKEQVQLSILPQPYELPVFIQLKQSLDIYPTKKISFFLEMPCRAGLYLESDSKRWELISVEKKSLKQIWDGEITASGNLYYYYTSALILDNTSQKEEFPLIPFALTNPTRNIQRVQEVVVDGRYLTIYQVKERLVTSTVSASLTKEEEAQLTYSSETAIELQKDSTQLCSALVSPQGTAIISPLKKLRSILDVGT